MRLNKPKRRLLLPEWAHWRDLQNLMQRNGLVLPLVALIAVFIAALLFSLNPRYATGALAVIGVTGLMLIAIVLIRLRQEYFKPLGNLRAWSQHLRSGDLAIHVPVPNHGEMVSLVRDINGLTDELNVLTEEMDTKVRAQTDHIASKSRSLEILYDIATDLSTARNLDELLGHFLDTLMVLFDARAATVRLNTNNNQTVLVASHGLAMDVVKQEQLVDMDRCLCGQIARKGGIGIQEGIAGCNRFLDGVMLEGPCSEMIVVPLQYQDRILGVYNIFLERPSAELGKDVRDLLNSIGMHLGLAIEKTRLDENERRLAIMEERNFIGSELHDSLAQSLVSMRLQVKLLGEILHKKDIRAAQEEVDQLREAVGEAHVSLRELLANFRSRMDERGLIPSIEELVERFKTETSITVYLQNQWTEFAFSPTQEVQIFRIIQESLANVRKHSNAHTVRILLGKLDDDHLSVLIEDDGRGTDKSIETTLPGENLGMSIMRERAERIDGVLRIESEPGEGTRIQLAFPIQQKTLQNPPIKVD
ncbi:MAG: histidine kinase [Acidiferrobacterales bacterium]|nr:histidine kinase [Acidiferrobacterales bacterium]